MTSLAIIGDTPLRREDARFTTGQGAYLDDLPFDGLVHAVVLRSPHAQRGSGGSMRRRPARCLACCGADRRGCPGGWAAADASHD